MDEVVTGLVVEVKERLHISHGSDDANLGRLVSSSIMDLQNKCGPFDIKADLVARELVMERVRYAYNDSLEFFDTNFLSQINSLSISLLPSTEEGETT